MSYYVSGSIMSALWMACLSLMRRVEMWGIEGLRRVLDEHSKSD